MARVNNAKEVATDHRLVSPSYSLAGLPTDRVAYQSATSRRVQMCRLKTGNVLSMKMTEYRTRTH
jgi:hypothetical protein